MQVDFYEGFVLLIITHMAIEINVEFDLISIEVREWDKILSITDL